MLRTSALPCTVSESCHFGRFFFGSRRHKIQYVALSWKLKVSFHAFTQQFLKPNRGGVPLLKGIGIGICENEASNLTSAVGKCGTGIQRSDQPETQRWKLCHHCWGCHPPTLDVLSSNLQVPAISNHKTRVSRSHSCSPKVRFDFLLKIHRLDHQYSLVV